MPDARLTSHTSRGTSCGPSLPRGGAQGGAVTRAMARRAPAPKATARTTAAGHRLEREPRDGLGRRPPPPRRRGRRLRRRRASTRGLGDRGLELARSTRCSSRPRPLSTSASRARRAQRDDARSRPTMPSTTPASRCSPGSRRPRLDVVAAPGRCVVVPACADTSSGRYSWSTQPPARRAGSGSPRRDRGVAAPG